MSQNGPGASFAGRCDNVRVNSRYGKIEQWAEREEKKGEFYFLQRFITFYFPLLQASPESANSAG